MLNKLLTPAKPTKYTEKLNRLEKVLAKSRDLTYMLSPMYLKPISVNTTELANELDAVMLEVSAIRKEIGV